MGIEEQKEEREVLDSIFPDEITDISDTAYRIAITLDITVHDDDPEDPPTILLNVSYPEEYPDVPPNLDLSSLPNAARHSLLDVAEDKTRLLDALTSTIEESMGMAMVFTLVSTLKDAAETLVSERQRQAQNIMDIEAAKVEEEENRKFHGTSVTRESFLKWRDRFRNEIAERERREKEELEAEEKKKRGRLEEKKMTGRQLWETGMIGKGDEDDLADGDDLDGIATSTEKLKVET